METVTEFSYLGDRINSVGRCVAAVTSRSRLGKIHRMPRFTLLKEISFENQRNCMQKLCESSNT